MDNWIDDIEYTFFDIEYSLYIVECYVSEN